MLDGIETLLRTQVDFFPDLNLLVAVSKDMWAVKLLQQIPPVLSCSAG